MVSLAKYDDEMVTYGPHLAPSWWEWHPLQPDVTLEYAEENDLSWHDFTRMKYTGIGPRAMEVPNAFGGHHFGEGDCLSDSNHERLLEDFGDYLRRVGYQNGHGLALLEGQTVPQALVDVLDGLADYPVYDESDYSEREWKAYEEAVRDAVESAVRRVDDDDRGDLTDEQVEATAQAVGLAYVEAGTTCRAEEVDYAAIEEDLTSALRAAVEDGWEAYARSLNPSQPEVLI